ncbi:MAG: HDOD domain-containing protein, partial [Pseudomonadales bacterium]|nr:HDOD domain-containing protein [Pseudomonadales bacterium]
MEISELKTAFYDAMFDCDDTNINPIEENVIARVHTILNDRKKLSSYIAPLPVLQIQLLDLLDNEDVEFQKLADLIEQDPALATRVLRIVNSPAYITRTKPDDLLSSIKLLGVSGISSIASSVLMENIRPPKPIYYKMFGRQIWEHSLHCAHLCRRFAVIENEDEFSAHFLGLIHDVGKIIVFNCLSEAFSESPLDGDPGSKVFKDMMSETSRDISYFIARDWELPEKFWMPLEEQSKRQRSPMGAILYRANLCAELYLLLAKKKIEQPEAENYLESLQCDGQIWQQFT